MSTALVFLQTALGLVLIAWGLIQFGLAAFAPVIGDADPATGMNLRPALLGLAGAIAGAIILII